MENKEKIQPKFIDPFQIHVSENLGELKEGQKGVKDELAKMNGSVKELTNRMNAVEQDIITHPLECPIKVDLGNLDTKLARHLVEVGTEQEVNTKWWGRIWPYIRIFLIGIVLLLLTHAKDILEKITL